MLKRRRFCEPAKGFNFKSDSWSQTGRFYYKLLPSRDAATAFCNNAISQHVVNAIFRNVLEGITVRLVLNFGFWFISVDEIKPILD